MTISRHAIHHPRQEHSIPWFWPMAAIEFGEAGVNLFQDNLRYVAEAVEIAEPPAPAWAASNRVALDLDTMRLRDFSAAGHKRMRTPVLIDAPYAGHSSTIADYAIGQSLVETLQAGGLEHMPVTDWKSVTEPMENFNVDKYLTDINAAVDYLGRMVDLIGLCQGGWMSAMYAARFPGKPFTKATVQYFDHAHAAEAGTWLGET